METGPDLGGLVMSTIVVYADGSHESARAMAWCASHAVVGEDDVVAVYGLQPVGELVIGLPIFDALRAASLMQTELDETWTQPLRDVGVRYRTVFVAQPPARALEAVAVELGASLIVAGKRPHGLLRDLVVTDVATAISHDPPCPLVIVPEPSRSAHRRRAGDWCSTRLG
jgi:nucleotide-binding universal stress UspA family protein